MRNSLPADARSKQPEAGCLPILRGRMPELDAIRGIAILGVVFYHLFYWLRDLGPYPPWQRHFLAMMAPGQFGVNLFFVLSGFLITGILLDTRAREDYFARFYYRRALRILPAYYFTLLIVALLGISTRGFLILSTLYCPNLAGLFGLAVSYPVLWSLGVEEHFYFLWPLAVRKLTSKRLFWISLALLALSPVSPYLYFLRATHVAHMGAYGFYTWNNTGGLALGAVIAQLLRRPGWGRPQTRQLAGLFVLLAIVITAAGYPAILTRHTALGEAAQFIPWNLGCAALLCIFLLAGSSGRHRWVTPAPLTFLGTISYGLYLYHLLFFYLYSWVWRRLDLENALHPSSWAQVWMRALFVGVTAVLFSYFSRQYLEEPFLKLKDKLPGFLSPATTPASGWVANKELQLEPEIVERPKPADVPLEKTGE